MIKKSRPISANQNTSLSSMVTLYIVHPSLVQSKPDKDKSQGYVVSDLDYVFE